MKILQDQVWNHGDIWGEERFAIRNWLQAEWEEAIATKRAEKINKKSMTETYQQVLDVSK